MSWQKHKETILFNKNLLIADTCSLLISALFAQLAYYNLHEDNVLDSVLTAIIEYCIDTPIFLALYFLDHRKHRESRIDPITGIRTEYKLSKLKETKRLLGIFSICDIMYVIIKIFIQFQFLANTGLEPYTASLISSLVGWAVFLVLINITLKATRIFSRDELIWYYSLILAISIANSIIFFSNLSLRMFFDNVILDASAAVALISAILVVIKRHKLNGVIKKLASRYVFVAILFGLIFWFTAEMIWTYYQLGLGIENPFPSAADGFWFVGYAFFGFALYTIFQNLLKTGRRATDKLTIREHYFVAGIVSIVAALVVISTYIYASTAFKETPSFFNLSQQEFNDFIIALAYPVFDSILLVPVVTIIWSLRRVDPLHAHWILLCSFVIMSTIGDIGFSYSELTNPDAAESTVWIWDTFFNSSYICLAASLLWYRKFNIPLFESVKNEEGKSS